jgi:O-antigen/teichoic acid export membrane protein
VATPATPFKMTRIGRHGLIYGGGVVLSKAVAFLMLPIYTRYLTPADYGVLRLLEMVLEVASIVAGSRLGAGIFWFYHKAQTDAERRKVLSTAVIVLLLSYAVATAGIYVYAPAIAEIALGGVEDVALVRIAGMGLAFESLFLVPTAYLRLGDRSVLYVAVMTGKLVLQVALNVVFVVFMGLGAKGVLLSTLAGNILTGTGLMIYLVKDIGLQFSKDAARDLLRFGMPFVATQVATFILTFGDRYFLRRVSDTSAVGLYALAYQFGFLLAMLSEVPFSMVWEPARFEIAKRPDRDDLYARGFIYFNLVLVTIALCIALFVGDLLHIMAAPAFHPAADLVPIILIAYVLQSWTLVHNIGIQVREQTAWYTLATWAGAIVALIGYALLIPRFYGLGAALATVASFAVREWAVYAVSQRLWPVRYQWGPVIRATLLAVAACVVGVLLPRSNLGVSLSLRVLVLLAYLGCVWQFGVLTASDRLNIRQFLRRRGLALLAIASGRT